MPFRILLLLSVFCFSLALFAQQPASQDAKLAALQHPLQPVVEKQFGPDFTIDTKFQPMYADVDADGTEDLIVVAFSKHPLGGSGRYNYKVSDPYDSYFGVGDPKITTGFATFGDGTGHCILIIHNWKAADAKAKWVIVNVPFTTVALGQATVHKKTVAAIAAKEIGGLNSMVFFDGKKYRWEPSAFEDDNDEPGAR
jgi:hypothetical protein